MQAWSSAALLLEGRRVLIVGACGGIGRAAALCCAREGAAVGLGYRSAPTDAEALAAEIRARNGTLALPLQVDITRPGEIEAATECFAEAAGGLDGLVVCAGVCHAGLLVTAPLAEIAEEITTNLLGAIACCRAALPAMLRARRGTIVLLGSAAAERPFRGQAVYAATKGALAAFARALAVEYAPKGIRALCVQPGPIDTAMLEVVRGLDEPALLSRVPARRLGKPEEVAEFVAFLLSERAAFITGSAHDIDGGYGRRMIEEVLRARRSVRRFKAEAPPRALIERVLAAATWAPSASNRQPWRFFVVTGRPRIAAMAAAVREAVARVAAHIDEAGRGPFVAYGDYFTRFEGAPVVIAALFRGPPLLTHLVRDSIGADERERLAGLERDSGLIGVSLAVQNLLLMAHDLGLGASGMTGPLIAGPALRQVLDVPAGWEIAALIPLGYPDEAPAPTERKDPALVTRWIE